jgi:hypothetical protein
MRVFLSTIVLVALASAVRADVLPASVPSAEESSIEPVGYNPFKHGMVTRTAALDSRTGKILPTATRVQPVVGSVQRTSVFANPLTHKARYSGTVYNPLLGQFCTHSFRR